MITPAPTSPIDRRLARGVLGGVDRPRPGMVTLLVPGTSYELHLLAPVRPTTPVGRRTIGTIHAEALRVDVVGTGGRYVEPVVGPPQRIQGMVVATDEGENTIVVDAGVPIHCRLTDPRQRAADFAPGQMVSFDVREGAWYEPRP